MTTLVLSFKELPREFRRMPVRETMAVRRGIEITARVDAHRWIQWAIRGGGMGGNEQPEPKKPRKPRDPAGTKKRGGVIKKLKAALSKLMSLFRSKRIPKVPPPKKAPDPCARRDPPPYRQPIDTGDYARAWASAPTPEGAMVYSTASPPVKAGVIEKGRRAAWIPLDPLAEWVRRKLGCNDPKKARSIAYAISKWASQNARVGLRVLERAHPKIAEAAIKNVRRELRALRPGT